MEQLAPYQQPLKNSADRSKAQHSEEGRKCLMTAHIQGEACEYPTALQGLV